MTIIARSVVETRDVGNNLVEIVFLLFRSGDFDTIPHVTLSAYIRVDKQ